MMTLETMRRSACAGLFLVAATAAGQQVVGHLPVLPAGSGHHAGPVSVVAHPTRPELFLATTEALVRVRPGGASEVTAIAWPTAGSEEPSIALPGPRPGRNLRDAGGGLRLRCGTGRGRRRPPALLGYRVRAVDACGGESL